MGLSPPSETTTPIPFYEAGLVKFLAPMDPSGSEEVSIQGVFIPSSCDMVLLARSEMPAGVEMTKGATFPIAASLAMHPQMRFGLEHDMCQQWTVVNQHNRVHRVHRISKKSSTSNTENAAANFAKSMDLSIGGIQGSFTTAALIKRLHHHLGHPNVEKMRTTLIAFGLSVPSAEIVAINKSCTTCASRPLHAESIPPSDSQWRRGAIAQQDLTEPRNKGIDGCRYISTIYDSSTGYVSTEVCRKKFEAIKHASNFLANNPHVSTLRVDNAGELTGEEMVQTCLRQGVGMEEVAPGGSQSLGGLRERIKPSRIRLTSCSATLSCTKGLSCGLGLRKAAEASINFTFSSSKDGIPAALRNHILIERFNKKALDAGPYHRMDLKTSSTSRLLGSRMDAKYLPMGSEKGSSCHTSTLVLVRSSPHIMRGQSNG